ncbi:Protein kinase domain protein [Legionella massiliensis]|uniref:Protein kinase domain protein n=1 Tax=Legionella massiliensis TaxID=1034943 RepID=A0A078L253_9GAMM|nr:hypothetical protein [Legionella massiliensis]CDZ78149.1 Protein kinase domain protein [Legionella massiliensis]CEE13887.1 Protein kinase domain protein [Legionella massiliensis]
MLSRIGSRLPFKRKKKASSLEDENQELADSLIPFREHLAVHLAEKKSTLSLSKSYKSQIDKKPKERDESCNTVLKSIPKGLDSGNLLFVGNNNFNMKVNTKNAAVTVQGMPIDQTQIDAIGRLSRAGTASFLPVTYGQALFVKANNPKFTAACTKNQALNPGTTRDSYQNSIVVSCIEQFPMSFNEKVKLPQHSDSIYTETADIAEQLSTMLTTLSQENIVWTDIKPGNLLARDDGSLAVADFKGLVDINTVFLQQSGDKVACNWNANTTTGFLSSEGFNNRLFSFKPDEKSTKDIGSQVREYFFNEWQKEYSYQVGILLYVSLTGKADEDLLATGRMDLNYDLPVFKTPQGQEYQRVLEALTHKDPDQRISHNKAAALLQQIASEPALSSEAESECSVSLMMTKMDANPKKVVKKIEAKEEKVLKTDAVKKTEIPSAPEVIETEEKSQEQSVKMK